MNEMNYNIQDFCCFCLSISNEKCSKNSSKYPDNLTPFDKIKTLFVELSSVMNSENRICFKCSDIVDSIYKFHKTCLKNINMLNSSKNVLKLKKQCNLFINVNKSKQFEENTLTPEEVKIEPPESPLNNDGDFCNTDFASESHSSGAMEVNEELEMNYETCDEESVQVKKEIRRVDLNEEWVNEIEETWQDELFKQQIKDFENISVELPEKVFIKEEILEDPLLEDVAGKSHEKQSLLKAALEKSYERRGYCESIGENSSQPLQEEKIHEEKEEFDCAECDEILNCKSELDSHMLIHSKRLTHTGDKSHKCNVCGKLFNRNGHLKAHILIHTGEKPHKCDICGKCFTLKEYLKTHMLTHTGEKRHKCDICGKLFNHTGHLKTHMSVHTGEKPYKCEVCGKLFSINKNLKTHMLLHIDEKSHKCDICGKLFKQNRYLKTHMLIHTGEKPHKCDICDKSFTQKNDLRRHMLIHTDEKRHKCDICGKLFNQKYYLNLHMLIHSGNKPYICDICGKLFIQTSDLNRHMLTHTDEKPYKCDTCGKSFARKDKLKSHMSVHSSEKLDK